MKKRWLFIIIGSVLCILFGLAMLEVAKSQKNLANQIADDPSTTTNSQPSTEAKDLKPAPDFSLETLDGNTIHLSETKGKPTLIYFWTSWCGYCKRELSTIQEVYEQYHNQINLITINITKSDNLEQVSQYVKENQFTFPTLLDEYGDVSRTYQILGTPTSFFINQDGYIEKKFIGNIPNNELDQWLNQLEKQ